MVPDDAVWRWEMAYRRYGDATKVAGSAVPGDPETTRGMVAASRDVATAWREMERVEGLPWWVQAALVAAAQAFEFQARDWDARTAHTRPHEVGSAVRPLMRLSTQPRPSARRQGGGSSE